MQFNLAAAAKRQRTIRRKSITLREVSAPLGLSTDLYVACYKPVVDLWAEAGNRIAAEYARTLSEMTADGVGFVNADIGEEITQKPSIPAGLMVDSLSKEITLDSPVDVQSEIDATQAAFERLYLVLTPAMRTWALRVEQVVRNRWRGAVLSATAVDLQTLLGPADVRDTLESYIAWNTDLIRDVSDQARKRIADRVFSGLTQRKPAREVAKEIREAVGMARDRSLRIASDQLSKVSSSLAEERRREAGLEVWMWLHSGKLHPRKEHQARDGLLYSDNPALVGKSVDGKVIHAPPERGDRPGQPVSCGCRSRGILVFEFDE